MYRWRPLGTARLRWHVDQTWTRHARSRGAVALRVADLAWQGDPRRLPPTSEPRPGDRLVWGEPWRGLGQGHPPIYAAVRSGYSVEELGEVQRPLAQYFSRTSRCGGQVGS
jgi:hypothetical protein